MEQIEKYLAQLIKDPENDHINFELAFAYEKEKQYAAAISYYLRCAEYTSNNTLASECLIRCSFSINKQGGRDQKELHYIKQAIGASPCSLEPYYIASLYFSWRGKCRDSYLYACLGININENNLQKQPFSKEINFSIHDLYYQKAVCGTKIGKINEARKIYIEILQNFKLSNDTKSQIIKNIKALRQADHPIISYNKDKKSKLKYQFQNYEKINENFSQIYQDMFVLSMTNGKKEGTYLEIGAGYPKKGNNTFLLEKEFDWKGVSIDINPKSKELFDKIRKNKCICVDATSIDYNKFFLEHYDSTSIDYLQLDCDPANITFKILEKIPFDTYKFGVITYEHDFYNDPTGSYREKSRVFLKAKGYKLICGNISPLKDKYPFEDWWIHPELIDENIWKQFERMDDLPINGEKYMLSKCNNHENEKALVLSNNILDNFILKNSEFFDFDANTEKYDYLKSYNNLSGINEYRLYSYLSTLFNNITILDIGTGYGTSAIALSHNETNQVISYNIVDQIGNDSKLKTKKNIIFKIKNVLEDLNEEFIKNVKIVMIDIDHFGEEEKKIINKLEELNYSGIILLDDIHHPWEKESKCMKQLWDYIKYTKYDITKYGHNTGTGIFLMNFNIDIIFSELLENEEKNLYDFIPCYDQKGNDLYRIEVEDIEQVLKKEYNNPQVKGVNTKGYVKNNIEKLEQINGWCWDIKANKADGIYIKKTINDTLVKCSQSSIPVLGTLVCTTTKWIEKQIQSIDFPVENYIIINNNENFLAEKLDILVSKGNKFIKNFKVYHMPYNLGCAEGWNTIIKSFLFSPYWVIVNDDVSFTPGFLKELHETALENPDAGLIHGNPCNLKYLTKFGSFDMFLIRDWVIKDFGLFDTNFYPAYQEDYDYIFRLRNSSVKIINQLKHKYYHGDTFDYSKSGQNTKKFSNELSNKLINIRYKNFNYFYKKWNSNIENINESNVNDIYKYPFNNPANKLSMSLYDIEFAREKSLQDVLPSCKKENNTFEIKLKHDISFPRPNVIVIDDFYKNVDEIRNYALSQIYQPPENHGAVGYRCESGKKIMDGTKEMFETLLGGTIPNGNQHGEWGYSTNGCFQWCNVRVPIVYHCDSQKYAAIIYLTPNAPPNCGTSFFRHKNYKIRNSSIFSKSDWYKSDLNHKEPHLDKTQWEIVDSVGNVYNRLVIFDAQYIHAVTEYFGEDINNSRLFQLFFFNIS